MNSRGSARGMRGIAGESRGRRGCGNRGRGCTGRGGFESRNGERKDYLEQGAYFEFTANMEGEVDEMLQMKPAGFQAKQMNRGACTGKHFRGRGRN